MLRDYQQTSAATVIERARIGKHQILVLPTGGGKTTTAAEIVRVMGVQTLWLAHRTELIQQAERTLREDYQLNTGIIQAGKDKEPLVCGVPVYVASIQTLARRAIPKNIRLIIIDECHHATAASYGQILNQIDAPRIGLTATPFRHSGEGLGDIFDEIVVGETTKGLIEKGYLHDPRVIAGETADLAGVRRAMGDFVPGELAERMSAVHGDIVETWKEKALGKKTVLFAVNVQHSKDLRDKFIESGVRAAHIDGTTPKDERASILAQLANHEIDMLCNCMILTEGWDLPTLECAIVARPTQSLNLHLQMIGRIMRMAEGKDGAIVIDHGDNHYRHGFVAWDITYSLDPGEARAAAEAADVLGMRRCPECLRLSPSNVPECPSCGYVFCQGDKIQGDAHAAMHELTDPRKHTHEMRVEWWNSRRYAQSARYRYKKRYGEWPVLAGDNLVDVLNPTKDDKKLVFRELLGVVTRMEFDPGWASHKYKDTFGVWPKGFVAKEYRRAGIKVPEFKGGW